MPLLHLLYRRPSVSLWMVLALTALVACEPQQAKPVFNAVDLTGASYAKDFQLPDTGGRVRSLSDFAGKVVVVFFGYTQCPDVCPTTMAELAQAKQLMGLQGRQVQGIFITLDPDRDTTALLSRYVTAFDSSFVALRTDDAHTRALAESFHVFYEKREGSTPGNYTVDHTAGSFVYDPQGHLRLFVRYGAGAKPLAQDLVTLLNAPPLPH